MSRLLALLTLALLLLVVGLPILLLERAVKEARACFAALESRPEAALPDCTREVAWLEPLPWIGRDAMLDREEMQARQVALAYLDAAVGAADREAREARFETLAPAYAALLAGSSQQRLDRLGPPLPAPDPGLYAVMVGDREALRAQAARWTRRAPQIQTLEALLLEGDFEAATEVAAGYLGAADEDVRVRAAALRCLRGDEAGLEAAHAVERRRAEKRSEGLSQSFGEARVVVEACAARTGRRAPEIPAHGHQGRWDQRTRFMAMRLRGLEQPGCQRDPDCRAAREGNLEYLRGKITPHEDDGLALVALAGADLGEEALARLLPSKEALGRRPRFAGELLAERHDAPFARASDWAEGAALLRARGADAQLVDWMRMRALAGYAQAGESERAEAARAALVDRSWAGELGVAAALLSGDRGLARERAASLEGPSGALLRAELALPDEDEARRLVRAALSRPSDPRVKERARWLLAGLEGEGSMPASWPWVGEAEGESREARLEAHLDMWRAARQLPAGPRRAFRYQLLRHRGDAPAPRASWLWLAGKVAGGQVEIFLDAAHAIDGRTLTLRARALHRWLAAARRGDAPAAELWRTRYRALAALAQDPERRDLLQTLRL